MRAFLMRTYFHLEQSPNQSYFPRHLFRRIWQADGFQIAKDRRYRLYKRHDQRKYHR